jgi:DNA mismatch repair protein MSH2
LLKVATVLTLPQDRIKIIYGDDEQQVIARVGVVFRVARQDSHRIQQQSGKAISVLRASKASGLWFTTPAIDTLGTKWKALKRSIEDAEAVLVDFLATEFQSRFQGVLDELARRVAELDVLVSFALVSHKHKFVRASTRKLQTGGAGAGGILRVHGMFDPFKQTTGDATEPCDEVAIELSLHSGKTFLLLDGDEKASCTRLLQLLGSVAILNQLGCCVPCRDAELPVFDAIYLRTGAYDQQLYGYSTFMTEMREMSLILSKTTPASLVLIEDLCRGTSTCTSRLSLQLGVQGSLYVLLLLTRVLPCFS